MKKLIKVIGCLILPLLVGGFSSFLTRSNIKDWYLYLNKPSFNPPSYVFGPVWTVLYLLMGISFYLIIKKANFNKNAVYIFFTQLTLNFFWSLIFFKWHNIYLALVEIVFLWISIVIMIYIFYKENKWAAYLNIPYLLWVSFATFLTYSIWLIN
ncbi:MAG: TspO/MBR family protein [Solirubrobacteraceae bacterium]